MRSVISLKIFVLKYDFYLLCKLEYDPVIAIPHFLLHISETMTPKLTIPKEHNAPHYLYTVTFPFTD